MRRNELFRAPSTNQYSITMFQIYYPNFGFYLDPIFDTIEDAVSFGKSKGFQFIIINTSNNEVEYQSPSIV